MKKNLLITFLCFLTYSIADMHAQNVPNAGFENWSAGNPDDWLTNNATGFAVPITQVAPSHSGSWAIQGEVVTSLAGPSAPLLASTDMSGTGFVVTQAYSDFNFYYKQSLAASEVMSIAVIMNDAGGNFVGGGGQNFTGNVSTYTLGSIPIIYIGPNPVECVIIVTLDDTITGTATVGSYFILDDMALTGLAGINELPSPTLRIEKIQPNPVSHSASIYYSLTSKNQVQLEIYAVTGQRIMKTNYADVPAGRHQAELDASTLPAGLYFLKMTTSAGSTFRPLQVIH